MMVSNILWEWPRWARRQDAWDGGEYDNLKIAVQPVDEDVFLATTNSWCQGDTITQKYTYFVSVVNNGVEDVKGE